MGITAKNARSDYKSHFLKRFLRIYLHISKKSKQIFVVLRQPTLKGPFEGTVASLGRLCLPDSLPFSKAEVNCFLHVRIASISR